MSLFSIAGAAVALLSLVTSTVADCESFGIDITSGGTFFQNINSTDYFTALQEFEGCQDDVANNVLVDPNGDQTQCSDTPLTPDDTPQLVNCTSWPKDQLYTGDWSLLIISNNGNGDPIAYERDFSLTVGPQQTTTVTPTVTVSDTQTPIVSVTTTSTTTVTTSLAASTVQGKGAATITVTPKPTTITSTKGLMNIRETTQSWKIDSTVATVPASCSVQPTRHIKDPVATILPSILGELDQTVANLLGDTVNTVENILHLGGLLKLHLKDRAPEPTAMPASAKFRREIAQGRIPNEEIKRAFVLERRAHLAKQLNKRAPDEATVTVTDTTDIVTTTLFGSVAPTQTITTTQLVSITQTVTPPAVTGKPSTITAPAVTRSKTVWLPVYISTITQTRTTTITNHVTTTSSGAAVACASSGGLLVGS